MAASTEARGWFERGVFDLSIAQAHLQSRSWLGAAQHARQAAVKFLQAGLVKNGSPEASPRIGDLTAELQRRVPAFQPGAEWVELDQYASASEVTEAQARRAFVYAENIRDALLPIVG